MTQEWTAVSPTEREAIRQNAEEHASDNAGPKMTQVRIARDRLLNTVADVAKDRRDEGRKAIQHKGHLLVGGSLFIALLNLFLTRQRGVPSHQADVLEESEINPRHNPIPLRLAGDSPRQAMRPEWFASGSPYLRIILTAPSPDSLKELHTLLSGERFPRSRYQSVKRHMHDPNTM